MTKGEQTRQLIIHAAAALFNQQGYVGSSINDVMAKTGLQKGGIYRHFQSKEELAVAAFAFACQQIAHEFMTAINAETNAVQQLLAFIATFHQLTLRPPIPGGCPILNTIVDSDDGDPTLRVHAAAAIHDWEQLISQILAQGIQQGTVRANIDPQAVATVLIGGLEGGLVLTRAHQNRVYIQHAVDHLVQYVQRDIAIEG